MTPCVVLVERSTWEPYNSLDDPIIHPRHQHKHDTNRDMDATPKRCVCCGQSRHLFDCMDQSPLVFDFLVCSKRCSVIMVSRTSCNLLLASFGSMPSVYFVCERSRPQQTHCPCCVMGLTIIRSLRTYACRDSLVIGLPSVCILGHLHLQRRSDTCILVSRDAVPAPCFCTLPVLTPNVICLHLLSDLTRTACPPDSML